MNRDKKPEKPVSPSVEGEESISGDMTNPELDDDTLANAQKVGT
ncbi:MAG: hypothetical protein Q7R51_01395 [bacterium]|nr:hypothetical protein [bacterium]